MASSIDRSIESIAKEYAELVSREIDIVSVYLFGSYAKSDFSKDSDIDIAVIGNNFLGDPVEDALSLMRIRRKVDYRIEPHPFSSSEFDLSNPYVREIVNTGIKIQWGQVP